MSQEQQDFLRAIYLNAGDEAPINAYQDWLEEQGRTPELYSLKMCRLLLRPTILAGRIIIVEPNYNLKKMPFVLLMMNTKREMPLYCDDFRSKSPGITLVRGVFYLDESRPDFVGNRLTVELFRNDHGVIETREIVILQHMPKTESYSFVLNGVVPGYPGDLAQALSSEVLKIHPSNSLVAP